MRGWGVGWCGGESSSYLQEHLQLFNLLREKLGQQLLCLLKDNTRQYKHSKITECPNISKYIYILKIKHHLLGKFLTEVIHLKQKYHLRAFIVTACSDYISRRNATVGREANLSLHLT